ncbi:hypothetical protein BKA70DRAFT_1489590 [Coprinopsis sp. MPI-PUGE-AT-0042]|nr:hypothetical protein BKA70DRAFT_1489590 [Coprinopsis sp. MPI-PUGE-AT-0042]
MASEFRPPSDQEMDTYGFMFAVDVFVSSTLNSSLFVVQIVLVLYGVSGFFATPKDRRRGRLRFIIISSLMLAMCAIDISLGLWKDFLILFTGGPDGVSYLRAKGVLDVNENWRWDSMGDVFFYTAIALGDILMATLALSCNMDGEKMGRPVSLPGLSWLNRLRAKAQLAGAVLHVAMNIMITSLIVFRVMQARSRAAKAFPDQEPPRWYSEVTALVVESAASARYLWHLHYSLQKHHFDPVGKAAPTLSPQMIIVRVTRGKAWNSTVVGATDEGSNPTQPIQFARSTKEMTASNISDSL